MWTFAGLTGYAALKAADAALGIADPAQAAIALNAQTATVPSDIPTPEARQVVLLSGDWVKIKTLAKQNFTGTVADQAIGAAELCIDTLTLTETLHTADDGNWATIQPMIQALLIAGVLSASAAAAWAALRDKTGPVWQPAVTPGDIQTARKQ